MNRKLNSPKFKKNLTSILATISFLAGAAITASPASATGKVTERLKDRNSTAKFELDTQRGMFEWKVDGTNHAFQDYFWYRIGNKGPEKSISTLKIKDLYIEDTNERVDDNFDVLTAIYELDNVFELTIKWSLQGATPGSGKSNINDQILIKNIGTTDLKNFSLFAYTDLNLTNKGGDDTIYLENKNKYTQYDDEGTEVSGTQNNDINLRKSPNAVRYEIAKVPTTLNKLTDGDADNLSNTIAVEQELGKRDVSMAWQWIYDTISSDRAHNTKSISRNKIIQSKVKTPEPSAMIALFAVGSLGLGLKRKKQQVSKI